MDRLTQSVSSRISRAIICLLLMYPSNLWSETTILALGDSVTQGYGLSNEDGFVQQLSEWMLRTGHSVRIINGGVSGDTTAGGLARLEWHLQENVEILIVALGSNDFLRGIDPNETNRNLDQILAISKERGLKVMLIGITAPSNFGPEYKEKFDKIFPVLASKYNTILIESFFSPILQRVDEGDSITIFLQPDMLHPNARGIGLIVEEIGPKLSKMILH